MQRLAVSAALVLLSTVTFAQSSPSGKTPKNRYQWMTKLCGDLRTAMTNTPADKKTGKALEKNIDTLERAVDAHQNKKKVDESGINGALKNIHKQVSAAKFRTEDKDVILDDLLNLPLKEKTVRQNAPRPRGPSVGRRRFPY